MQNQVSAFFKSLENKKIYIVGMGVSHFDLIKMFKAKNLNLSVCDRRSESELEKVYEQNYLELKRLGVNFITGDDYLEKLLDADVIFRTPGMYYNNEILQKARKMGIIVTSEMETFFDLCPCKIYAVTGSDGKTTTTTLISEFLKQAGKTVHLGGNIGRALLPIIEQIKEDDIAVVELSSFQLISMRTSPNVAVITNIAPNHLDVHKTMEEYIDSKKNLIIHQNAFSKTVLNFDNELTRQMSDLVRGRLSYFSRNEKVFNGAYLDKNGDIYLSKNGVSRKIMNKDDIKLPGMHNVENYLTAISALDDDVLDEDIVYVAKNFGGVEHRIEFVRELDGVRYYNDSIATSPTRTIAGLNSFDKKIIVIAGGYDKNIPYEPLAKPINEKVKVLILLGATAKKIEKVVKEYSGYDENNIKIINVGTLEEAVQKAREIAKEGDVVSLSPASASFDLYINFEQRGNHFKNIVNNLE